MVTKYVWWDDVQKHERSRMDLWLPKPLHQFVKDVAKKHGVTANAFVTGMLAYAADSNAHRRLRIDVVPAVRVTEAIPEGSPVVVPAPAASPSARKRYNLPNVP